MRSDCLGAGRSIARARRSRPARARRSTSRWRSQSIGTAIEMYWWIRANVSGWTSDVGPLRRRERLERSSPAIIRRALPPSIRRSCLSSKPGELAPSGRP